MHDVHDVEIADEFVDDVEYDDRTPLDKTIDRIGMGQSFVFVSFYSAQRSTLFLYRELSVDAPLAMWIW